MVETLQNVWKSPWLCTDPENYPTWTDLAHQPKPYRLK